MLYICVGVTTNLRHTNMTKLKKSGFVSLRCSQQFIERIRALSLQISHIQGRSVTLSETLFLLIDRGLPVIEQELLGTDVAQESRNVALEHARRTLRHGLKVLEGISNQNPS